MKNKIFLLISCIALLSVSFKTIKLVNWKVKEGYRIKHIESGGEFKGLKADIWFDESSPEKSKIKAEIDARTLNAGGGSADGKKILEAEKFPAITFETTAIKKTAPGQFDATGYLTLKGITKQITFPFNFDSKKNSTRQPFVSKETFAARFSIVAKDFNLDMGKEEKCTIEMLIPVTKE